MLSENAKNIFKKLYSRSNESIDDTFKRAAKEFSTNEEEFELAYKLQKENKWRPNTPVYFNSGTTEKKIYAACYVVGLEDSMDGIYDVLNVARKIFNAGAGAGIPIGNLREKDASIFEGKPNEVPEGKSSGAVSFLKLYDVCGETTKSGGRARRAAILCSMPVWHPDIYEFIRCKDDGISLPNMNISVGITDKFMDHLETNTPFPLHTPYDGSQKNIIQPDELWNAIAESCHRTGDPGVLFVDNINKHNVLRNNILIETTNPCVTGDTQVITDSGFKCIDEMSLNDSEDLKILSYDHNQEKIVFSEIEDVLLTEKNANIIELYIEEDGKIKTLKCTPDHEIYTRNRGYVEAKDLNEDDDIFIN